MAEPQWGITPRASIEATCAQWGTSTVLDGCLELLAGEVADRELLDRLAGPAVGPVLANIEVSGYWLRVWALRGLYWAVTAPVDIRVGPAVAHACADPWWRVREMAARVAGRHHLEEAFEAVTLLREDPVERTRSAGAAALRALTEGPGPAPS